jgi:hypothetical protein
MTTTLNNLEALPHQIMTAILEYLSVTTLYTLEQTSKSLRYIVEFNVHLKYVTKNGERHINPLVSCNEYAVHYAWKQIRFTLIRRIDQAMVIRYFPRKYVFDIEDRESLVPCNLLDKPAVYPFLNNLTIEAIRGYPGVIGIEIQGENGNPVTIRDGLEGFIKGVENVQSLFETFLDSFGWKEGTTFTMGLF